MLPTENKQSAATKPRRSLQNHARELRRKARRITQLAATIALILGVEAGTAQVVTGKLGSPSATTTIDGKQLPAPAPPFGGVIKESSTDSTPWWAPTVAPTGGTQRAPHHDR
jgi:hypothetical protein